MSRLLALIAVTAMLTASASAQMATGPATAGSLTMLNVQTAIVATGADTTEDTLYSYTIPANTLLNVGDTLSIMVKGICINSTDTKTVRLRIAGILIVGVALASGNTTWLADVRITKGGPNAQVSTQFYNTATNNAFNVFGTTNLVDTGTLALTVTGQNATTATAASITAQHMLIEYVRAP